MLLLVGPGLQVRLGFGARFRVEVHIKTGVRDGVHVGDGVGAEVQVRAGVWLNVRAGFN